MYSEDDLLPLSGLQHFTFCERRWALVHIEQLWEENRFTTEGEILHERAHSAELETRPGVLIRRSLPIHSFRLGLSGQSDVVEFHSVGNGTEGARMEGKKGFWRPYPVEYKRKRALSVQSAYHVQLCGQALCLEEMLGTPVPEGAIFDGTARRRQVVVFSPELKAKVEFASARMHQMLNAGRTPLPVFKKACASCSLFEKCQPRAISASPSVMHYLATALQEGE